MRQENVNVGRLQQNEDAALLHLAVHKWNGSSLIHALGTVSFKKNKNKKQNNVMHD